jgi:uncharacterized protein YecE (DUF72 family)
MAGRLLIGTSSWADPGFVEAWYPPGMPSRDRLAWYGERFDYVEVNSTFYAIPAAKTVERWASVTPDGFTFDVKLHQLLSRHAARADSLPKDMRDSAESGERGRLRLTPELESAVLERTLAELEPLAATGKLGAFLLQLTPGFAPDRNSLDELNGLVETLRPHRLAVELRHRLWVHERRREQTLGWFEEQGVAFVCVDAPPGDHIPIMPPIDAVTAPELAYFRLHGRDTEGYMKGKSVAERFGWVYSDEELREVRGRAETLAEQAGEVHIAFNNNRRDDAPSAARRLKELAGQDPGPPAEAGQQQLR